MTKDGTFQKSSSLIDMATVMTMLVPLLYITGWSFAYHYFDRFHLGLIGLDIPKEYLFLYSFWVVKDQLFLFAMALLSVVIVYAMVKYGFQYAKNTSLGGKVKSRKDVRSGRELWSTAGLILLPAIALALFSLFYYLGDRAADSLYDQQVMKDFPSYPRVRVWVTDEAQKEAGTITDVWSKGCFRLLLRNKDYLYIFESAEIGDKIPTEIIPTRLVRSVRVLPQYHRCEE